MSATGLGCHFAAGEIEAESYLWRDGFDEWLPPVGVADLPGGGRAEARRSAAPAASARSRDGEAGRSQARRARAVASRSHPPPRCASGRRQRRIEFGLVAGGAVLGAGLVWLIDAAMK